MKNRTYLFVKSVIVLSIVSLMSSCFDIVLFEAPETAQSGSTIYVKTRVKTDVAITQGFNIAYVLSYDRIYDSEDILLKLDSIRTNLSPFGYYDANATLTIPSNTFAGKYYLLAIPHERLFPTIYVYDHQTNVSYKPINILGITNQSRDLTTTNVHVYSPNQISSDWTRANAPTTLRDIPVISNNLRVTFSTENRGLSSADASITYFYIFKDYRPYLLGSAPTSAMSGNGRTEYTFERNIDSYGFTAGYYDLFVFSDFNNQVIEANESNNYTKKTIYINGRIQGNEPPESNVITASEKEALNKALLAAKLEPISENTEGAFIQSFEKNFDNENAPLTLRLFPNPTSDKVTVSFHQEKASDVNIQLLDATGKMILSIPLPQLAAGQYQQEIPLNRLGKGIYIVKCLSGQKMYSQKLIVQ